jgi:CRP-like cAMP-binding protein
MGRTSLGVPAYFPGPLREASKTIEVAAGGYLFHQGAAASACYRVVRGGTAATLQHAGTGDWLHEPGPYDDLHGSSAVAETPSLVLAVSARQFRAELRRDSSFASAWGLESAETARRLQRRVERLVLPARERVLHYLATEAAGVIAGEYPVGKSRYQWADERGSSRGHRR